VRAGRPLPFSVEVLERNSCNQWDLSSRPLSSNTGRLRVEDDCTKTACKNAYGHESLWTWLEVVGCRAVLEVSSTGVAVRGVVGWGKRYIIVPFFC
jgi:hypothetical protein